MFDTSETVVLLLKIFWEGQIKHIILSPRNEYDVGHFSLLNELIVFKTLLHLLLMLTFIITMS